MRSLPESNYRREKIYKLQIVEIGTVKDVEQGPPDWAAGAAKQPLVPAQLPHDVPSHWLIKSPNTRSNLSLKSEQYKTFMGQIGHPFGRHVEAL